LLDTGDALVGGGLLGDATNGEVIVAGMNLMGYDAMALGPFELSLGTEVLRQRMAESEFPMLSANAVLRESRQLVARPYTILAAGDHRLAVIGLTRPPDAPLAAFDVLDVHQAASRYVSEVAPQADVVVLLTNLAYRPAAAVAESVPGIDLLIAALPDNTPMQVSRLPETGTLAVSAEQPFPRHTGRRVGRLIVTLDSEGNLHGERWVSEAMTNDLVDDPGMQALLDQYRP
jgi:2',3'-cyclic-nucleotide 2'-phosphodiesterase/3'-nucleotidase